jgi:signal transduction histidine kinase/CheY-like chemotaxis protein
METSPELAFFRYNVASLREEALQSIAAIALVVGYIWLWLDIWPVTGSAAPPSSWFGAAALLVAGTVSYRLRSQHLHFSTHLLVWGLLVATACAVSTLHNLSLIYLFLLPVIFASVLLSARGVFLVMLVASGAMALLRASFAGSGMGELALPVAILVLVAFAFWLSSRNLHTTLAWFSNAYENAYRNEQLAREREAELRRVLKALDDATVRLERMNYSLTLERNHAREAHRLKQQFAQTISHELRTPLNLIVAFTELMAQSPQYYGGSLPPAYVRDLSIVHRNAQHLQNLVNDVLDLARIEAAQMTIVPEPTDPATLTQEAINTTRSLIESRGLELCLSIEPGLPVLWVDPTRIRQVLFNLLSNAVRFTEKGRITVSVCSAQEAVIFSVADTGIGIAAEDMPRLFRDFQQLDGTTRRRFGGAGLGLAISRRFVELHKGRIWVESEVGKGSTFSVSLPLLEQQIIRPSRFSWKLFDQPPAPPAHHHILLAVTRNPIAIEALSPHTHDYRVMIAPDLEAGRQMAQQVLPQCVLIDTAGAPATPNALTAIIDAWELPNTPFIACDLPQHDELYQMPGIEYLMKPVSVQRLREVVEQFGATASRILVVDDDYDFVRLMSRLFGQRVISAASGRDGLAFIRQTCPDLIFLDFHLPDYSGREWVQQVYALAENAPVIVLVSQDQTASTITRPVLLAHGQGLAAAHLTDLIQYFIGAKV